MSIKNTRACINAILDGSINESEFKLFLYLIENSKNIKGVDTEVLNPVNTWKIRTYDETKKKLASM